MQDSAKGKGEETPRKLTGYPLWTVRMWDTPYVSTLIPAPSTAKKECTIGESAGRKAAADWEGHGYHESAIKTIPKKRPWTQGAKEKEEAERKEPHAEGQNSLNRREVLSAVQPRKRI